MEDKLFQNEGQQEDGHPEQKEEQKAPEETKPTNDKPWEFVGNETVNLSEIQVKDGLYPRTKVSDENVERLKLVKDDFFDRIVVSTDLVLVDGQHRLMVFEAAGVDEVEVAVYKYESDQELLEHAISLNCSHGLPLSNKDKKKWARKLWSPKFKMKDLARLLGASIGSIENWTCDLRKKAATELERSIVEDRQKGMSIKESAINSSVSESTVKRVVQKHKAKKLASSQTEPDRGDTSPASVLKKTELAEASNDEPGATSPAAYPDYSDKMIPEEGTEESPGADAEETRDDVEIEDGGGVPAEKEEPMLGEVKENDFVPQQADGGSVTISDLRVVWSVIGDVITVFEQRPALSVAHPEKLDELMSMKGFFCDELEKKKMETEMSSDDEGQV
jgi:ParB-like chromosome segregation protein Spo0J